MSQSGEHFITVNRLILTTRNDSVLVLLAACSSILSNTDLEQIGSICYEKWTLLTVKKNLNEYPLRKTKINRAMCQTVSISRMHR